MPAFLNINVKDAKVNESIKVDFMGSRYKIDLNVLMKIDHYYQEYNYVLGPRYNFANKIYYIVKDWINKNRFW